MITYAAKRFACYLRDTRAVSALEYAILVGIIAVAMSAVLAAFGGNITTALQTIGAAVAGVTAKGGVQ